MFCNVSELIDSFLPLLQCTVGSDVRIATETTPGLPTCRTKVGNFQHALLNLVINARDAQPRDGVVRITTDCVEADLEVGKKSKTSFVRVTVQDYGCGISPDVMQRMFAPFFTTKGKSGSGLGLPQVLAFMQSVEGRLEISSDTGIGTSIRLLFPVGDARLSY